MLSALRTGLDTFVAIRLACALALAMTSAALTATAPLILKWLVDDVAANADRQRITLVAIVYLAALAGTRLADQVQAFLFAAGDQRFQRRLGSATFHHVLRLPMRNHLDHASGGLMQTLSLGQQGARVWLSHITFSGVPLLVQLVCMLTIVGYSFGLTLSLVIGSGAIAYGMAFAIAVRRLAKPTREIADAQVGASALLADSLANVETVKSCRAEERMQGRYDCTMKAAEDRWRTFYARRLENGVVVAAIFVVMMAAIIGAGTSNALSGHLTIGDLVMLNLYGMQILRPIETAGFAVRDLAQGAVFLGRWAALMQLPAEDLQTEGAVGPGLAPPAIRFASVSFAYAGGAPAVRDVTVVIPAGKTVAIVGPSGSGKTTLLRLLQRHYSPDSGSIEMGGRLIASMPLAELRSLMAVVTQDTFLMNASLAENILLARPDASEAAIDRAVDLARLRPLVEKLPAGLATIVGERGQKLSGGERQRVAIARALLRDAPILLLDEATSALDLETELEICNVLKDAARGRTTLIVTHRLSMAAMADEVVVLEVGCVAEYGSPDDLRMREGAYARMSRLTSSSQS